MAVKKQFALQQVLDYRLECERLCKQEFAVAKRDVDTACDQLALEKTVTEKIAVEFTNRQQEITSVYEMRLYADFFSRKREELKEQERYIEILDRVLEDRKHELLQATKEKKVMEKLKEKQKLAFLKEQAHKERLLLDEISIQKTGQE